MLKQTYTLSDNMLQEPAAFRRLCVETSSVFFSQRVRSQPPSGGCVLKLPMFVRNL